MKIKWKPPFFVSRGHIDLTQTSSSDPAVIPIRINKIPEEQALFKPVKEGLKFTNRKKQAKANVKEVTDENFNSTQPNHLRVLDNETSAGKGQNVKVDYGELKQTNENNETINEKRIGLSGKSTDHTKGECHGSKGDDSVLSYGSKFPKHDKTRDDEELIRKAIMDNEFLKEGLSDKEVMQAVVDAMYAETVAEDSYVIKEGEIGSHLYVCAQGVIEVYKEGKKVNTLKQGKIFGELALLCNTRRNATIKALTPCNLWVLDRKDFNQIVKRVGTRRIEEHMNYLRGVPLLSKLDDNVLKKMTNLLKAVIFNAGTPIIKQGEEGNLFYIITVGTVIVTVKNEDDSETKLAELGKGQFFGERALLEKDKRGATVTAHTNVECLTLDREPFINYLGGLKEVRQAIKMRERGEKKDEEKASEYSHIQLQDLEVKGTLGVGGFGRVELVEYKKDRNITFALKKLKKNHIVAFEQESHVLNEKRTMMCCCSPFIARLYNTYKNSKYLYFLMEPCLGGDVWSLLQKRRFFDEKTVKFITACVVEAFHYLHDRGIIYRDLKPENLLFDSKGYVKLVDFGFAKKLDSTEKTWTFAGTPEYLAPEIISNKGHDRAADYWALGVFIYELLVGKPPFRGTDHMATFNLILKGINTVPFSKIIGKPAENLIKRLCKEEPTERLGYQKDGINGIKQHAWFSRFDWVALERTEMKAPFQPKISGPTDLSHFDECTKDKEIPPDEFGDWDQEF